MDEVEPEQVLNGKSVDFLWPVPLELLQGLDLSKTSSANAPLDGPVVSQINYGFAFVWSQVKRTSGLLKRDALHRMRVNHGGSDVAVAE
ncbi:MAG: hypothetical protein WAU91_13800 [Desulfatitalea sp.]